MRVHTTEEELARLKKLVTQLFSRTQLLSTLLREAGISVPAEPALEKLSPLKWSNKINVEDAEKCFGKIEESKYSEEHCRQMRHEFLGFRRLQGHLISVKNNSESKREKSAEPKVPSKRKSVTSSHSSGKKSVESSNVSKDVNSSIENQENQVNSANSNDDNLETADNASNAGSKEPELNTSKCFFLILVLQVTPR